MTVAELMALLGQAPPDADVYVDGPEGGLSDVRWVALVEVDRDVHDHDDIYVGRHEYAAYEGRRGVVLPREICTEDGDSWEHDPRLLRPQD